MIKYNFYEKYILVLFYINKNVKILIKQNVRTTIKFLSFLNENIKHFNYKKEKRKKKLHSSKNCKQKVKNS